MQQGGGGEGDQGAGQFGELAALRVVQPNTTQFQVERPVDAAAPAFPGQGGGGDLELGGAGPGVDLSDDGAGQPVQLQRSLGKADGETGQGEHGRDDQHQPQTGEAMGEPAAIMSEPAQHLTEQPKQEQAGP